MWFARFEVNLLVAAVTALSAALAFVVALHLYARCYLRPSGRNGSFFSDQQLMAEIPPPDFYAEQVLRVVGGGAAARYGGLDAKALRALPVFLWESNNKQQQQAAAEGCAVCLGPMVDGELGRLLPACGHVFHVECIDKWFVMSTTCPVCRTTAEQTAADDAPSLRLGSASQSRAAV